MPKRFFALLVALTTAGHWVIFFCVGRRIDIEENGITAFTSPRSANPGHLFAERALAFPMFTPLTHQGFSLIELFGRYALAGVLLNSLLWGFCLARIIAFTFTKIKNRS
ncbi:MAG: hypothetical protein HKL90_02680 [Elusimicrobia bacterium]|nr:hypothetical protein [Elusimicrobiota bacterium]